MLYFVEWKARHVARKPCACAANTTTALKEEKADETDHRSYEPVAAPGSCPIRRRAAQYHSHSWPMSCLRAEEGQLSLTATDMDMDIATEVGCSR